MVELTQTAANQVKYADVERFRAITHPETESNVDFEALKEGNRVAQEVERLKALEEEISLGNYKASLALSSRQELPNSGGGSILSMNELMNGLNLTTIPEKLGSGPSVPAPVAPAPAALPLLVGVL